MIDFIFDFLAQCIVVIAIILIFGVMHYVVSVGQWPIAVILILIAISTALNKR
jgi:uncharacterized membrane protein